MSKISALLLILSLLFLAGCSDNDDAPDRDKDGVVDALDCEPNNAQAWTSLNYRYVDRDGDGYVQLEQGKVCSNGELPEGYLFELTDDVIYGDCDDSMQSGKSVYRSVSIWLDSDGDGYGAGERVEACIGDEIPEDYVTNDLDCNPEDANRFSLRQYYFRDADQDGYLSFVDANFICAGDELPATYYNFSTAEGLPKKDCDDDPVSGPNIFRIAYYYPDVDRDGYGAGEIIGVCTDNTMPTGYASNDDDCNDQDSSVFKSWSYRYRDKDGDSFFVEEVGSVCATDSRPDGYSNYVSDSRAQDCDDDPQTGSLVYRLKDVFIDSDRDGYGTGAAVEACVGQSAPEGKSFIDSDCDDSNQQVFYMRTYAYVDADNDRYVVEQSGELCTDGMLPQGYYTNLYGSIRLGDCDDNPETGMERFQNVVLYVDGDLDGYGTGEGTEQCIGSSLPPGFSRRSDDCDDEQNAFYSWVDAFSDEDGDTVGSGQTRRVCGAYNSLPDGFSSSSNDCAPQDPSRWRLENAPYKDNDGDGFYAQLAEAENICMGDAPPANYRLLKPAILDCDDSEEGRERFQLRTLYQDNDGDGFGVLPLETHCLGYDLPVGYAMYGIDLDDTDAAVTIQNEISSEEWQLIFN